MGRGRKSTLPQDKAQFLESHLPEFLEKQPNVAGFFKKVERAWSAKFPVETRLGLPLSDSAGVVIDVSERTHEEQLAIGAAHAKDSGIIQNWFYNRASKEKKLLNEQSLPSSSNGTLQEILKALGTGRRPRRKQRREIWQKRNGPLIKAALEEAGFGLLMGSASEEESDLERRARISKGRKDQAALRWEVVTRLMNEASAEEMAEVEEEYQTQEQPSMSASQAEHSPEELQRGIDKVGPLLKNVHKYVEYETGLVGGTMLVGPIPNLGGKIGTQTYCHGVTPAGHTLDQAHSGWTDQVIKPLQQFGKKVFDHQTRRKRAIHAEDDLDVDNATASNAAEGPSSTSTTAEAPPSSTPEVQSDGSSAVSPPTPTTFEPPNSSDAVPPAPSDRSGATTSLFWPGEEDVGLDDHYPPLDFGLGYVPLSEELLSNPERIFAPPTHSGVSPSDPVLPSSMLGDSLPSERLAEPISSARPAEPNSPATTLAIIPPATSATQSSTAAPPLFSSSWENGRDWVFPSPMPSTPSTPRLVPCTPASSARNFPASAPPPARRLIGAGSLLPPASASAPSTPTARRIGIDLLHRVDRPSPLRHVHTTAAANLPPSAPPPLATRSAASPPSTVSIGAAPSTPSTTPTSTASNPSAPASTIVPAAGVAPPTTPSSTPSAAHTPSSTPPTSTPTASAVVPITTVTHLRSALTAEDFPESRPLSNAPAAPKTSQAAVSGRGGRGGGGRGRGSSGGRGGGRGRGRGRGGARGGGAGGGDVDTGYLLRVDPEKGNVWQIGTVSRQRVKEIRAGEKARDAAATAAARDRDHGIFVLPPPPPGHAALPAGPAALGTRMPPPEPRVLGLRGPRERTNTAKYVAQKKRTMEEVRTDALQRKADKAAEKAAEAARKKEEKAGQKRKANAENLQPGPSKRRR
ncbi:hypothetical protein R3P38DRAFT_3290862 [Favolaschia claudopus]|uniref:Uncharacterized protein n=1 Tax=Favolaschia claudopus TaxID=2862362 RepID=A0AAV9ZR34_9AGAR